MSNKSEMSVFLTGASGVVGTALAEELADESLACLVHSTPLKTEAMQVRGDIALPSLGLGDREYLELASSTDIVIHSAAMTDFTVGSAKTDELNIQGTSNVLDFTASANATFYYISTAFVDRVEQVRRSDGLDGPDVYIKSKQRAEQLVRDSGVPAVIIRPSVVIGDSRTGFTASFQGLLTLAGACLKGTLPLLPLRADALIDFVPQDFVAEAICELARSETCSGTYWLTAGDRAITADQAIVTCLEVAASLGRSVHRPRLIDPSAIDRLIRPVFIETLPERARLQFDQMLNMATLFSTEAVFPSSADDLFQQLGVLLPTNLTSVLSRSVEYLAGVKGLAQAPNDRLVVA